MVKAFRIAIPIALICICVLGCSRPPDYGAGMPTEVATLEPSPKPPEVPDSEVGIAIFHTARGEVSLRAWNPPIQSQNYLKGLVNIQSWPEHWCRVFDWQESDTEPFWMKNCYIPLDLCFVDETGHIIDIQQMEPLSERYHHSPQPYRWAVELYRGTCQRLGISEGDSVEFAVAGGND